MKTLREIDALVAEKVMGLTITETEEFNQLAYSLAHASGRTRRMTKEQQKQEFWRTVKRANGEYILSYTTDGNAALQVIDQLEGTWDVHFSRHYTGKWACSLDRIGRYLHTTATAITVPIAICLAALAAVGYPVEEVAST